MKTVISLVIFLYSFTALAKIEKIYYDTDDGRRVCLDPQKWEIVKRGSCPRVVTKTIIKKVPKIIKKTVVKEVPKIITKTVIKKVPKIITKTVVKEVPKIIEVDKTKTNTISLLLGFPFDYYNYDVELNNKMKYPLPGIMYTRRIGNGFSLSVGHVLSKGFGGVGYDF